jgi:hypothetical protein
MLLDPTSISVLGTTSLGGGARAGDGDGAGGEGTDGGPQKWRGTSGFRQLWNRAWREAREAPPDEPVQTQRARFAQLAAAAPRRLRLSYRTYEQRGVCADAEADRRKNVLGIDGEGSCVYWESPLSPPAAWELLSDGSCELSDTPPLHGRAHEVFGSRHECERASRSTKWKCVRLAPPASRSLREAAYCVPDDELGTYASLGGCEAACHERQRHHAGHDDESTRWSVYKDEA